MPMWSRTLLVLRAGATRSFSVGALQGIVCTPSYHSVLAVLLVYAHRPPSRSFRLVILLNAVMLFAIPFLGHHYLTDVASGAALALVAILVTPTLLATVSTESGAPERFESGYVPLDAEESRWSAHVPTYVPSGRAVADELAPERAAG
jgi:hypothetical protein